LEKGIIYRYAAEIGKVCFLKRLRQSLLPGAGHHPIHIWIFGRVTTVVSHGEGSMDETGR
jgi:hypothetical protein